MNIITNDITFDANFDSPNNPNYKTFIIVHGWSEKYNTYSMDTNVCIRLC